MIHATYPIRSEMESERFDRVLAVMQRKIPDRVPWALWGHFPACKWLNGYSWEKSTRDGEESAKAHIALLRELDYNMDMLKVTPYYRFMAIQWGSKFEFVNNEEEASTKEVTVTKTKDWEKLWVLDPKKELREYVRCNEILARDLRRVPFIYTIPSPIIQAMNGVSTPEQVLKDMKQNPDTLRQGLETITETTKEFAKACVDAGAAGIFFGIGGGGRIWKDLDQKQLEEFALGYDKKILDAVKCPIKFMHICSTPEGNPEKLMEAGWFKKYPVTAINWASHTWTPTSRAKEIYGNKFAICGGLDHEEVLRKGTPKQVENAAKKAIEDCAEGGGFMLGPGCTVFSDMPIANYNAVGRAIWKYGMYKK
jgi:uroporphyrinogen decarboxylase